MSWYNTFFSVINQYRFFILMGLSGLWISYLHRLGVSGWWLTIGYLFNPYVLYGLWRMWVKRDALVGAYYLFENFWRARRYEKNRVSENVDLDEKGRPISEEK